MFDDILADIEGVFASSSWTANSVKTFPANYDGAKGANLREYASVSVLPSSSLHYAFDAKKETSGLVAVKLFTEAGRGQGRLMAISDMLDIVLQNKTLTNGTVLGASYLQVEGVDPSNASLYSASYFIPFNFYGE